MAPDIENSPDETHPSARRSGWTSSPLLVAAVGLDVAATFALVADFLYARATARHWKSAQGFILPHYLPGPAENVIRAVLRDILYNRQHPHQPPKGYTSFPFNVEPHVSLTGEWAIVGVLVLSWLFLYLGEVRFRNRRARPSKFVPFSLAAAATTLVAVGMVVNQIRGIPQFLVWTRHGNILVHVPYATGMIAFGVFFIAEFAVLAGIGVVLAVRAMRRTVTGQRWQPISRAVTLWGVIVVTTALIAGVSQIWY